MSLRVVVTDQVFPSLDIEREVLGAIGATIDVARGTPSELLEQVRDADALLNTYHPITAETIASLERCRVIARYGIGVDNVDLAAAAAAGIVVTNVPDYCVEEVATHTVACLLSLWRRLPTSDADIRAGAWGIDSVRPLHRLEGRRVGLIGYGRIARRVASLLRPFGVDLQAHDPHVSTSGDDTTMVELDVLLQTSDAVLVHAPLTDSTRGLIGPDALSTMKRGSVLVNTSRGSLVQFEPLAAALVEGHLDGAALDVFESEPPDPEAFEGVPNLLLTPHTAFYSEESLAESQRKAATQVLKVLTGSTPDYPVTP